MMRALLLALCILSFDGFSSEPINTDPRMPMLKDECLIEYGIQPDINYNNQEGVSPLTEEQMYCVAACIYRDDGLMKPDGTIDTIRAEEYFGTDYQEEKEIFFSILNACNEGNIHCSLVQCMFRELKNYIIKSPEPTTILKQMLPSDNDIEFT